MTAGKRLSGVTAMLAAAVLGVAIGAYGPRSLNAATPAGELPGTPVPAGVVPAPAAGVVVGQATPDLSKASAEMAEAAQNFLAALTPEQLALATFEMKSDERTNWHFIPKVRKGLPLKDMTPAQKALAHALLSSGLSYHGYSRAVTIMSLDQILKELEAGKGPVRDPEGYFVSIFGTPGAKDAWGWRVEGHHLSLNFTIVDGKEVASTPAFYGNNPAKVLAGPRAGLRTLAPEEDLGRQFVTWLSDDQKKKGVLPEPAPKDIYTAAARKAQLDSMAGITWADLKVEQREALKALVSMYADRHRAEIASQDIIKIDQAGWDKVVFAWQGGFEPGQPHYYRIKGPTFLVEYDNTQNNANHIHTVWRDIQNDFGDDVLGRHLTQDHPAK